MSETKSRYREFKARTADIRGGVLWEGQAAPSPSSRRSEERCKLPQKPRLPRVFALLSVQDGFSSHFNVVYFCLWRIHYPHHSWHLLVQFSTAVANLICKQPNWIELALPCASAEWL